MPETAILNIVNPQHMAFNQTQYDLNRYVRYIFRASQFWMHLHDFPQLTDLLKSYMRVSVRTTSSMLFELLIQVPGEASQNLDFMRQRATPEEDPFLTKTSRALEHPTGDTDGLVPNNVLPRGQLPLLHDHSRPKLCKTGHNETERQPTRSGGC